MSKYYLVHTIEPQPSGGWEFQCPVVLSTSTGGAASSDVVLAVWWAPRDEVWRVCHCGYLSHVDALDDTVTSYLDPSGRTMKHTHKKCSQAMYLERRR